MRQLRLAKLWFEGVLPLLILLCRLDKCRLVGVMHVLASFEPKLAYLQHFVEAAQRSLKVDHLVVVVVVVVVVCVCVCVCVCVDFCVRPHTGVERKRGAELGRARVSAGLRSAGRAVVPTARLSGSSGGRSDVRPPLRLEAAVLIPLMVLLCELLPH
jgi:hypothetical protein